MKKLILGIVCCLLVSFFLTGCGKGGGNNANGRIKLTLGAVYVDDNLKQEVLNFNKEDKEYEIEIKDYSDVPDADTAINTDIISGQAPDLIVLINLPEEEYIEKGILEDLSPYFEKDPDVSEADLQDVYINAVKKQGGFYYVTNCFEVVTLMAAKKTVSDGKEISFAEIEKLIENMGDDTQLFALDTKTDRFLNLMYFGGGFQNFVDMKNGSCHFDSEEFKNLIALCGQGKDDTVQEYFSEEEIEEMSSKIKNGKVMFLQGRITPDQVVANQYLLGKDITSIGSYFSFDDTSGEMGIYSKSKNKEGAWRFLKRIVSKDYQMRNMLSFHDIPTRKDCFAAYVEMFTTDKEYTDGYGNRITPFSSVECVDGTVIETTPLSEEDVRLFEELLNEAESITGYESDIYSIMSEEMSSYYSGDKNEDETAKVIQNRVQNYLNERK